MLTFLEVQQFALIDKVRIGFAPIQRFYGRNRCR